MPLFPLLETYPNNLPSTSMTQFNYQDRYVMKQDAIALLLTAAKPVHIHPGGRDERQPCSSERFSALLPGSANLHRAVNAAHCTGFPS